MAGDSEFIVEQINDGREQHALHLVRVYQLCRTLAEKIGVRSWTHHCRLQNAMAVANWAMDTRRDIHLHLPDISVGLASLVASHLRNAIKQWMQ